MKEDGLTELVSKHGTAVVYMITGGFEHLIRTQGGQFMGFSMRATDADCLLVIRAEFQGVYRVAFVPGRNGANCLARCHKDLRSDKLVWGVDKFKQPVGVKEA